MRYRSLQFIWAIFSVSWLSHVVLLPTQAQEPKKSTPIQASCTRPDCIFKVGETATFKVDSDVDGELTYRLSDDGFKTVKEGKL